MIGFWKICFLLIFVDLALSRLHRLPEKNHISPCQGHRNLRHITITCSGLNGSAVLYPILEHLKNYTIDKFIIKYSKDLEMWPTLFRKSYIKEIIIENSSLESLYMWNSFKGLEKSLTSFSLIKSKVKHWFWMDGTQFVRMKKFHLDQTSWNSKNLSEAVTKRFPKYLIELNLTKVGLERLGNHTFKRFHLLEKLDLSKNNLKTWNRSYLSIPADELYDLNLEHNAISSNSFETNLFQQMPLLENINFANNKIEFIRHDVFGKIWPQLEIVKFSENIVRCDCHVMWIANTTLPSVFDAPRCIQPAHHANKILTDIHPLEFCSNP